MHLPVKSKIGPFCHVDTTRHLMSRCVVCQVMSGCAKSCHMSVWEISDITKSQWRGQVPRLIAVQAHTRNFQLKRNGFFCYTLWALFTNKASHSLFLQENAGGWSSRRPTFLWSVAPPWGLEEELCFSAPGYTFTFLFTMTNQPRTVESA